MQEFDALRGVFALIIAIYHYTFRFGVLFPALGHATHVFFQISNVDYMNYVPSFFFVLSGYFILDSAQKAGDAKNYALSKFFRLFPTYWISLLITTAMIFFLGLPGKEVSLIKFIANLTMMPTPLRQGFVDNAHWAIEIIAIFYLLIFLVLLFRLNKHMKGIIVIWLCASILIHIINFQGGMLLALSKIASWGFMLRYAPFFALGILMHEINQSKKFLPLDGIILCMVLLSAYADGGILKAFFVVIYALIFTLGFMGLFRWIAISPLLFFGKISYAFYLIHQNVGYTIIRQFYLNNIDPNLGIIVAFAFSIIASTLVTYYVAKPITEFAKKSMFK